MYIRSLEEERETREKGLNTKTLMLIQLAFLTSLVFISFLCLAYISLTAFISLFFGGISSVLIFNIIIIGKKVIYGDK